LQTPVAMQIRKALWKFRIKAGKVLYTALKRIGTKKTAGAQERHLKPAPVNDIQGLCVKNA